MADTSATLLLRTEPIGKLLLRYSLPAIAAMVVFSLYNIIDSIFIGHGVGPLAISGLAITFPLMNLIIAFSTLVGIGGATISSIYLGQKDTEKTNSVLGNVLLLCVINGFCFGGLTLIFLDPILHFFGASPATLPYARDFMQVILMGNPIAFTFIGLNNVMRATGYPKKAMLSSLLTVFANIILAPIFIFHLDWGIRGAALATVISQCISASLVLRCMVKDTGPLHLDLKKMRLHPQAMRQILRIGLPAGFQGILFSLSNVVIQSSVNTFGEVIMAGNSAAANIEQFVYVSMNAMYQATISFTSQNYGAGNYHRIRKIMIRAQGCVLVVGLVLGNAATLAGRVLLSIYTTSPPVIEAGLVRMGIVCTTYALCGMMDVMVGGLRGIGYSIMPMLVSLVGACGLRLLWIATIFQLPQFHTIQTIYWSYPISWAITFGVHVICFLWAMKKVKRQLLPEGAPAPVEVPPTLEEETVSE